MQNTIHSDLIRGNINTIILKALFEGDRYGYDVIKEIEQKSSGQYVLKQPTLYSCLKRLEVQGFIRSYWGAKSNGGRRKYYTLTDMGREFFVRSQEEWEYSRTVIDKLISDKEYDFSGIEADYSGGSVPGEDEADADSEDEDGVFSLLTEEYGEAEETETESAEEAEIAAEEAYGELTQGEEPAEEQAGLEPESEAEPPEPQVFEYAYRNPAEMLDELFKEKRDSLSDDSYTGNLVNDSYTAVPQKKPPQSPFSATDFFIDAISRSEEERATPMESAQSYVEKYTEPYAAERDEAIFDTRRAAPPAEPPPQEADKPESGFLSYKTKVHYANDEDRALIERDYRDVLTKLVKNPSHSFPATAENNGAPATEQVPPNLPQNPAAPARPAALDAVSSSFKELGANISVRTHKTDTAKEHAGKLYYYAHRLMFVQYSILFAVMLPMAAFTIILARALNVSGPLDIAVYIGAGIIAAAFPLAAAVLKFREPDKKKRVNYSFKNSFWYRMTLLAICLIIIYLINIYAQMSVSFANAKTYLCSLLLPALYALCIPLSTVIFNALHRSGRYAVK